MRPTGVTAPISPPKGADSEGPIRRAKSKAAEAAVPSDRTIQVEVIDDEGKPVSGATVGVLVGNIRKHAQGQSDEQGKAKLHVSSEEELKSIYAFKSGLGLDYVPIPDADLATTGDPPGMPDLNLPVVLKLAGARTVRIKLVDPEGQPIRGIQICPSSFRKPPWRQSDTLSMTSAKSFQTKTDGDGVATFDWIPIWSEGPVKFWGSFGVKWAIRQITWDPAKDPTQKTVKLQRNVRVSGRVLQANGQPAPNVRLSALTHGGFPRVFPFSFRTNRQGRFEIPVAPGAKYMIGVDDPRWGASARASFEVQADTPVQNLDFRLLETPTRIHGQVTLGPDKKPWTGRQVILVEKDPDEKSGFPGLMRTATTDSDGRYEFLVGPGKFALHGFSNKSRQFTVTDEKERTFDYHVPHKPPALFSASGNVFGPDGKPAVGSYSLRPHAPIRLDPWGIHKTPDRQ
jgi:hypothetical protein